MPSVVARLNAITHSIVDNGMRVVGPLFVLLAISLIGAVIFVLVYELIPFYSEHISVEVGVLLMCITIFLATNILFNYYMTVVTHPGKVPDLTPEEAQRAELMVRREPEMRKGEGFTKFCKFCKKPKPARAHHCHICKSCVLRMDHHCPWVNNCVGFFNHKYFVLFLFYLWSGCGFVAVISVFPFWGPHQFFSAGIRGGMLFAFVITVSVFFALSMLLGWHIYLVLTGQTTIEFYYNRTRARQARMRGEVYQNEYDLGTNKNFQIFFGTSRYPFAWLMPSTKPAPGDGIAYLTRSEHLRKLGVNHHYV